MCHLHWCGKLQLRKSGMANCHSCDWGVKVQTMDNIVQDCSLRSFQVRSLAGRHSIGEAVF